MMTVISFWGFKGNLCGLGTHQFYEFFVYHFITICPGVRLSKTSCPIALSLYRTDKLFNNLTPTGLEPS